MNDPAQTHLAKVKVAFVHVRTLPPLNSNVIVKVFLATFAATHKPERLLASIAKPLSFVFFVIRIFVVFILIILFLPLFSIILGKSGFARAPDNFRFRVIFVLKLDQLTRVYIGNRNFLWQINRTPVFFLFIIICATWCFSCFLFQLSNFHYFSVPLSYSSRFSHVFVCTPAHSTHLTLYKISLDFKIINYLALKDTDTTK